MNRILNGQTALVTGGTRGIGRAVAHALLQEGAFVVICGTTQDKLDAALKDLEQTSSDVAGVVADVAKPEEVSKLFAFADQHGGSLSLLVNNAGIGIFRPVADLTPDEWRKVVAVNLDGVYYCSREAVTRMQKRGGGSIINISSLAGRNPFAGGAAYNASKFGVNGFSEALMLDHRHDGIRVTYIMPGSVDTDFSPRSGSAPWKIAPQDVAEVVLAVLRMPARTTVSRVELRPSMPPK